MADVSVGFPHWFTGFDDEEETAGKNRKPAIAAQIVKLANAVNAVQFNGRMLFNWWGDSASTNSDNIKRFMWNHHHIPGNNFKTSVLLVKPAGTRVSGQGIRTTLDGVTADTFIDYSLSGVSTTTRFEPTGLESAATATTSTASGRTSVSIGSLTTNGPTLVAGLVYEPAQFGFDPTTAGGYVPIQHIAPGRDIITIAPSSSREQLDSLRSAFLHAWNRKRPQIGWSVITPGVGDSWIGFSTSSQNFRYIFEQTVGDGGTAPSTTGPGLTFPARYSARGLQTVTSAAVYVYAAMSGATDTGSIGISHKSAAATMHTISTLYSPYTISGTTFAWYSTVAGTPATVALRADLAFERIVLCAKSSGATDYVRIGAFVIMLMPSQVIV